MSTGYPKHLYAKDEEKALFPCNFFTQDITSIQRKKIKRWEKRSWNMVNFITEDKKGGDKKDLYPAIINQYYLSLSGD